MGTIKQGILGGFSGKVGNVIGTSWKGISVVKVMPQSVANPKTAAQEEQRSALTGAVAFAVMILGGFIKPMWDRFSQGMSGYNAFVSANIANFNSKGLIDPSLLVASRGKLTAPETFTVTAHSNGNASISHTNAVAGPYDSNTDVQMIIIQNETTGKAVGLTTAIERGTLGPTPVANVGFDINIGDKINAWLAFRSVDGTKVSAAAYDNFTVVD